jgi:hypothetical protein
LAPAALLEVTLEGAHSQRGARNNGEWRASASRMLGELAGYGLK